MGKVLFVRPPMRVHHDHIDYPFFAGLGAWVNAAHLRSVGHEVTVIDAFTGERSGLYAGENDDYDWLGEPLYYFLDRLPEDDAALAVIQLDPFMTQDPSGTVLAAVIGCLKAVNPKRPVWLADLHVGGMNYVAYDPQRFLRGRVKADGIIVGESENALAKLVEAACSGADFLQSGRVVHAPPPDVISAYGGDWYGGVDFAAYAGFMDRVFSASQRRNLFDFGPGSIPSATSRGCPFSCSFCSGVAAGPGGRRPPWRPLSKEDLEDLVGALAGRENVERVIFLDDAANVDPARFDFLLDLLRDRGLKAQFPNGLRADRLTRPQIAKLADVVGVLSLSPESGSREVLDKIIGKRMDPDDVRQAAEWCRDAGLSCVLHFIIGLPGETRKQIGETLYFAEKMYSSYGAVPLLQFAVTLPGTRLFDECAAKGLLPDELPIDYNPLFQGRPMLKDGACGIPNDELVRLKEAFYGKLAM